MPFSRDLVACAVSRCRRARLGLIKSAGSCIWMLSLAIDVGQTVRSASDFPTESALEAAIITIRARLSVRQMRSPCRHIFGLSLLRMSVGQFPSMENYIRTVLRYFCTARWSTDHRERKLAADRARKTSSLGLKRVVRFFPRRR